jgi:hypothetical protein
MLGLVSEPEPAALPSGIAAFEAARVRPEAGAYGSMGEAVEVLGDRQMRIYPWGELPACLLRKIRKLEAYATVRSQLPLALKLALAYPDAQTR